MTLTLNLEKSRQALVLSLQKAGILKPPSADLAFNLDVSGSFDDEHRGGLTQALLERLVPWGMVFDPDGKLDVFTFSDGPVHAYYVGEITPGTCEDYIRRQIIGKVPGYNGSTHYSYVLEMNLRHFGWLGASAVAQPVPQKASFFGGMFGKKAAPAAPTTNIIAEKKRSIVIHVTDGESFDEPRTEQLLAESEARKDEIYFLFVGVSNQPSKFDFLKRIGDRFNNTGLVVIRDIRKFVALSDEDINDQLIGDELVEWLKK